MKRPFAIVHYKVGEDDTGIWVFAAELCDERLGDLPRSAHVEETVWYKVAAQTAGLVQKQNGAYFLLVDEILLTAEDVREKGADFGIEPF